MCNLEEWREYLYDKYGIIPITVFENYKEKFIKEVNVRKYNPFYRNDIYEPEYFLIDGVSITYSIPYDEDKELWYLIPHSFILQRFNVDNIKSPCKEKCGEVELSFEYTKKELQDKGNQIQEFVKSNFENRFKNYRVMMENVNEGVFAYNNGLKTLIKQWIEERKQKASSFISISKKLEIPLFRNEYAPNVLPVH